MSREQLIWGIHEGRHGEAEELALDKGRISIGWHAMGDLSKLGPDRESFKNAVAKTFPEYKAGAVPVQAGQLYRFVHEMQPGDLVVLPAKRDRRIHIGRVDGHYEYVADAPNGYRNQRNVIWLVDLPRTTFTQGALWETGSALTLFQVKNYADEYRLAVTGLSAAQSLDDEADVVAVADDEPTVAAVAEEIEESTSDFVLKQLTRKVRGREFEFFVAHLLEAMGYRTRVTVATGDGGVDIIAHKDALGFEPPIIKVQVKSSEGQIGEPDVKQLKGNLSGGEKGLFVTLGTFSSKASVFARTVPDIRLIDGAELVKLILEHYDQFSGSYRAAIPLKQVYVPAVTEG
ncbi:restriction endonuclease [Phenylobacterium aquaticum]|uniref:restriction endonuclease n=2 Tax=Phenylobacterium aquaticum TaxID=1763816 RepID=UPI0026EB64D6|nr:restriction endonuclease [Phenylobacterium aquaticum]